MTDTKSKWEIFGCVLCTLPLAYLLVLGSILSFVSGDRIFVFTVFLLLVCCFLLFILLKKMDKKKVKGEENNARKKVHYVKLFIPLIISILLLSCAFYSKDFREIFFLNKTFIFIVLFVFFSILLFLGAIKKILLQWALMLWLFLMYLSLVGVVIDLLDDDGNDHVVDGIPVDYEL